MLLSPEKLRHYPTVSEQQCWSHTECHRKNNALPAPTTRGTYENNATNSLRTTLKKSSELPLLRALRRLRGK